MKKAFVLVAFLAFASTLAVAAPRDANHARKVVRGWLKMTQSKPMDANLGQVAKRIDTFADSSGEPIYHIVYLNPSGYVIVPADDEVEPIVGFLSEGEYDPSPENPMGALVSTDMAGRIAAARKEKHDLANPKYASFINARSKWQNFESLDDANLPIGTTGIPSVPDVRVSPMVLSKWSQSTECGYTCYNYYTPNNYVCGCVATAAAQLMRFYQHPVSPSTLGPFTIYVNGVAEQRYLIGGTYAWSNMVLDPDCSITLTQRQAIGTLTHDAGVAVNMNYTSSGSGADTLETADAFKNVFGYQNAIKGYNSGSNIPENNLNTMLNPNLDSGFPCLLGITGSLGGHAIVCDGYGYNISTLYHHLNLGWAGSSDAWYDLPTIDTGIGTFTSVYKCVYNVYVTGSGEIISGRVTDSSGDPIDGATVTTGGGAYTAVTNAKGIYALAHVPSSTSYTVLATKAGYSFTPINVSTGTSTDGSSSAGNVWGVDFVAIPVGPPVAKDGSASTFTNTPVSITLVAIDDGLPNPPGVLIYIITSLPSHGTLNDPGAGSITAVPYTLVSNGNQVVYTPTIGYSGPDSFQFKANDNDGAEGGDSNIATVSINIINAIYMANMDTDPGWTATGQWQWGVPTGLGGTLHGNPDPTSGYTGSKVYGVNLDGDYSTAVGGPYYLTTQAIDCSGFENIHLKFYRWLNSDYQPYAWATIEVSNNASDWTTVWDNGSSEVADSSWQPLDYDISSVADNQPTVYLRWGYKIASGAWAYSGWNIDDVNVIGTAVTPPQCTLIISSTAGGHTEPNAGTHQYNQGTIVDINAVPDPNYHFVNWTGDTGTIGNVNASATTITMDANYTIQANFAIDQRTLTVSSTTGGTVTQPGIGPFQYGHGTVVDLNAVPTVGYHFVNWTGDTGTIGNVNASITTITMDANYAVQANFAVNTYTISGRVTCDGSGFDDVTMDGLPGSPITSGGGYYSTVVNYGWSGTVTPTKDGFTFTPPSIPYTNVVSDQTNQDYTATQKAHVIFSEDFESGIGGFTIDNAFGDGSGLWHLTTTCNSILSSHSTPTSLYYGQNSTCDYDAGQTEGVVTSPVISLAGISAILLEFNYMLETEQCPELDVASVEISENGGDFIEYLSNTAGTLQDSSGGWISKTLDLSSMAGSNVQIRFRFRTVDGAYNNYPGFYVDDVQVTSTDTEIPPMDLNDDGIVDFSDFAIFAFYWTDDTCSDPDWCEGSDSDHSGKVDYADLLNFVDYWLWRLADLDLDGDVDLVDYAVFANHWMEQDCAGPDWCEGADFDKSGEVDTSDLAKFVKYLLEDYTR